MVPFRVYSNHSVLETAKARIAWLFDEFPHVITGKD